MIKKINENEYVKLIKELWKKPRWHALMVIGLYLLFFLIMGMILTLTRQPQNQKQTILESYKNLETYDFNFVVNGKEVIGRKEDNIVFKSDDINYVLEDGNITCDEVACLPCGITPCQIDYKYVFDFFTPKQLSEYINNGEYISLTTYNDGRKSKKYEINNSILNAYFNKQTTFFISMIYNNENLSFEIDLTNYYNNKYIINIKYN